MSDHNCHAMGCTVPVSPEKLMCPHHWYEVHPALRRAVWNAYRPGQSKDKQPSEAWMDAALAAVGYVAMKEGKTPSVGQMNALGRFKMIGRDGRIVPF